MTLERAGRNFTLRSLPDVPGADAAEIRRTAQILFGAGDVVEIRAFDGRRTVSGYFDDFDALAREAARLDEKGLQVYATLNPVLPALLSRCGNRMEPYPKATTKDGEIARRRWLPVDLDPVRPSGISSTDEEKRAALERAREIKGFLAAKGWPEPLEADSGNGAHLLYRVDLPNDTESRDLVSGVLNFLDATFSDNVVDVDTGVSNAARIWKLYGTTARKGDDSEERPHRRSRILRVPEASEAHELRRIEPCR